MLNCLRKILKFCENGPPKKYHLTLLIYILKNTFFDVFSVFCIIFLKRFAFNNLFWKKKFKAILLWQRFEIFTFFRFTKQHERFKVVKKCDSEWNSHERECLLVRKVDSFCKNRLPVENERETKSVPFCYKSCSSWQICWVSCQISVLYTSGKHYFIDIYKISTVERRSKVIMKMSVIYGI